MKVCVLEQEVKQPGEKKFHDVLQDNIKVYEETAKFAKEKGCRMMLAPESGIVAGLSLQDRWSSAEQLPPIGELPDAAAQPTIHALSSIARDTGLFLVVSVIEKADAYYNTTVIFNTDGSLLGRHRKKHLYLEPGLSSSNEASIPVEIPGFGVVEFITCFDIFFKDANRGLKSDLAILISHWYDETPHMTLLSTARAWSISNQTPIVVCNFRFVRQGTLGAGVVFPNGNGQYSMSFSKEQELVHIFDCGNDTVLRREPSDVTMPDIYQPILTDLSRYDRVPLIQKSGVLHIDLPTISCQIMYDLRSPPQDVIYIMVASDGVRRFGNGDRLYLQELFVFALKKRTREVSLMAGVPFRSLKMSMAIKDGSESNAVFPFIAENNLGLVEPKRYEFRKDLLELDVQGAVVCAGFCRRLFHKDILAANRKRSRTM